MVLRKLILLSLLLFSFPCLSQETGLSQPWVEKLEKLNRAAEKVMQGRERLEKAPPLLRDSVSLQQALDSLEATGLDSAVLAQKKDSLLEAYSAQRLGEKAQKEAEERMNLELAEARAAAGKGLLPQDALELLRQAEGRLNPEAIATKAREQAGKLFSSAPGKGKEAQEAFDKYKDRYGKVESARDMKTGYFRRNALKGRPWPEHLVLGTLGQFGKQDRYNLDLAPYLAWRFTDLLSLGVGFQHRLSVDLNDKPYVGGAEMVRGYSAFADHQIKKGFFGRVHYERLNAPITVSNPSTPPEGKNMEWVPGLALGLGKTFGLLGPLHGYALTQYNVLHKAGKTPYLSPLQIRLGLFLEGQDIFRGKKAR
jgi:hypothetical protein